MNTEVNSLEELFVSKSKDTQFVILFDDIMIVKYPTNKDNKYRVFLDDHGDKMISESEVKCILRNSKLNELIFNSQKK